MSPSVTSPDVMAELNNSSRTERRLSSGWEMRTGRYSLGGVFRSMSSPRRRSMAGRGKRTGAQEESRMKQRVVARNARRGIRERSSKKDNRVLTVEWS